MGEEMELCFYLLPDPGNNPALKVFNMNTMLTSTKIRVHYFSYELEKYNYVHKEYERL